MEKIGRETENAGMDKKELPRFEIIDRATERQQQIKDRLYAEFGTDSLAMVNPQHFVRTLDGMGLFFTLPTSLKDQLR
jgi:hypothetical protein